MCGHRKVVAKILTVVFILIAFALAFVVSFWRQEGFNYVVNISRFFDVMLPVLAVGGLIKYLMHGHCGHHGMGCQCPCCKEGTCACEGEHKDEPCCRK